MRETVQLAFLLFLPLLMGAKTHWALLPPERPSSGKSIDEFVTKRLSEKGLEQSGEASKRILIRRIYLDMLGLAPAPEEVDAFVSDNGEDAYKKLVEKILDDPSYGERWARHWLDVVRYADSAGFETNHERPNAYHYRDYVIRAFNEDKPYDQFVFEQIAGDTVGQDAATGFIVAGPSDQVGGKDPLLAKQQRANELADMVGVAGSAFLGLTVGCARCHDHKFDPISQVDFYSMQAIFEGVKHGDRKIPPSSKAKQQLAVFHKEKADLRLKLRGFLPQSKEKIVLIDDENKGQVEFLQKTAGKGFNPKGTEPGFLNDPGNDKRSLNLSGGTYTWWNDKPGKDLAVYRPRIKGRYRIWLSWGCGWETHTKDALYQMDGDGIPTTDKDRETIATVNQQLFANGEGKVLSKPLWSGFQDAGVHDLNPETSIVLRGGSSGTAVTADVIALEATNGKEPAGPKPGFRSQVDFARNIETFPPARAKYVRLTIEATHNNIAPCIDELELWTPGKDSKNVATGAKLSSSGDYANNPKHKLIHINDGKYGNDRSWISNEMGKGWVGMELAETVTIDRIEWGRDRTGSYKDRLPTKYRIEGATEPGKWNLLSSSDDRLPLGNEKTSTTPDYDFANHSKADAEKGRIWFAELKKLEKEIAYLSSTKNIYAGTFRQPSPTRIMYRGDPLSPREMVAPDGLSVLKPLLKTFGMKPEAPESERRIAFARWLTDPKNPLTARVMVNRIWHYHFGRGIVATPSDFGDMGFRPTHPELLDWLANELVENGWSVKHIHRLILHSKTYRQASLPRKDGLAKDAGSELLWRFPPRRLEAEAIRDNALLLAGALEQKMYGPGFLLFVPNANYARNWIPKDEFGPQDYRRMIYTLRIRMEQDAIFGSFDCPDGGQVAPNRNRSTTPIQALNLFNSGFMADLSQRFAERIAKETGADHKKQIARAYAWTFGRTPKPDEANDAQTYLEEHGLPALCRILFNANEFLFLQ
jgi:hypothetical protein